MKVYQKLLGNIWLQVKFRKSTVFRSLEMVIVS